MIWKILLLAACALAAWGMTRPMRRARPGKATGDGEIRRLALCPKCGVYHSADSPCRDDSNSNSGPSNSGPSNPDSGPGPSDSGSGDGADSRSSASS